MTITKSLKESEINKAWFVANAEGKTLGRFATEVAKVLRGKHKPTFTPNLDRTLSNVLDPKILIKSSSKDK